MTWEWAVTFVALFLQYFQENVKSFQFCFERNIANLKSPSMIEDRNRTFQVFFYLHLMVWQSARNPFPKISFSNWCLRSETHTHTHTQANTCLFWNPAVFVIMAMALSGTAAEHFFDDLELEKIQHREGKTKWATHHTNNEWASTSVQLIEAIGVGPARSTRSRLCGPPILETSLWEAFNNTFVQQINLQNDFANVETKIQGINFLMSHKWETAEERWIGPLDFMSYVLSKSPWSLFSYSVDSFWLKK